MCHTLWHLNRMGNERKLFSILEHEVPLKSMKNFYLNNKIKYLKKNGGKGEDSHWPGFCVREGHLIFKDKGKKEYIEK